MPASQLIQTHELGPHQHNLNVICLNLN